MAVTIVKKFHTDTEYKDIAKVVFTSPNFPSPNTAGTRSHMPPGGKYMGTWFEAVDNMYRKYVNQDYAEFPNEMESFFGKFILSESWDMSTETEATFYHLYGEDYDVVGPKVYPNILYLDRENYGIIDSCISGTVNIPGIGEVTTANVSFSDVVGSGIINEWIDSFVAADIFTTVSGNEESDEFTAVCDVFTTVAGYGNDTNGTTMSGTVSGTLYGTVSSGTIVSGTLVSGTTSSGMVYFSSVFGDISGTLYGPDSLYSVVTDTLSAVLVGEDYNTLSGTLSGTLGGPMVGEYEQFAHQYSNIEINESTTIPRPRRNHGGNSISFKVTFGEAYSCRLTAWDDDTHSSTENKILDEEHYRVDTVAFRTNISDGTVHSPTFRNENCLVFPPAFDIPLKGNEKYYGDFDLIFSIDDDEYGEYLVFSPRLVNMDSSFIAGNYDFITTLHYQYT
jgi:hypothetical protein